jgi:predicted 3-demethylubiquinone-9 3-methyltransferase (glyoxalase superfamily)
MDMLKHKITPHLWFDKESREAAEFYVSAFGNGSKITHLTTLHDTPSGDTDIVSFELSGQPFMAMSAGPLFKFNPSVSFIVNFDLSRDENARKNLDALWAKLSDGGMVLMPLDRYPFSEHFGWVADRYGLSWQLILSDPAGEERPFIVPHFLFVGDVCGKAEEAMNFYRSVFKDTKPGVVFRYGEGQEPDRPGTIMFADFMLEGQWFGAADSAHPHNFSFNEAISFIVHCENQEEIDYYWERLSAVPEAEQCGWLKDQYGLSWQIVPTAMDAMMSGATREQLDRLTQAFLPMKKLDIAQLQKAYEEMI